MALYEIKSFTMNCSIKYRTLKSLINQWKEKQAIAAKVAAEH